MSLYNFSYFFTGDKISQLGFGMNINSLLEMTKNWCPAGTRLYGQTLEAPGVLKCSPESRHHILSGATIMHTDFIKKI